MKYFYLFIFTSFSIQLSTGQSFVEMSTGAGYNKQSFVKLSTGAQKQVNNDSWDLAFSAFGFQDAGIFINESAGSTMGQNLPLTELYYAQTTDWSAAIDVEKIKDVTYLNSEASWVYGAFNETRDTLNPFDYGWGKYQPATNRVIGDKVFVMRLRNGEFRKVKIESLTGTTYTFKYAKLDGTGEVTKTLNKLTDNRGQKLIFFSFTTNNTVDVLPATGFDLMYCRYISLAKDPNGTIVQQYNVTGVLTGPGVQTAKATGINPTTVSLNDYKDKFVSKTDAIGYDWKNLVGTGWVIDATTVYFVKTEDGKIYKLQFIDFEGSATGTAVIQKTDLGVSSSNEIEGVETGIFPNPVSNQLFISLDISESLSGNLRTEVIDISGKVMTSGTIDASSGFKVLEINTADWNAGMYFVKIIDERNQTVSKMIVKY
ncbi:MAG: HmuY family protein [Saprospiraceae bacterium]